MNLGEQDARFHLSVIVKRLDNFAFNIRHDHTIPGIWDSDNGDLAGKPCEWCAQLNAARAYLAKHGAQ